MGYLAKVVQCMHRFIKGLPNRENSTWRRWSSFMNALKYLCSLFVLGAATAKQWYKRQYGVDYGVFWKVWLGLAIVNASWKFLWDVLIDWEVPKRLRGENQHFPRWIYVICVVINLVLRTTWTLSLAPEGWG